MKIVSNDILHCVQITDLRYSTEDDPFEAVNSQLTSLPSVNQSKTNSDGGNLWTIPSRTSSVSAVTPSQINIKSNYIDNEELSVTAEISDFVVETEVSRNNLITNSTTRKSKKLIKKVLSMSEQVDEFIDQCIEIESNKKMFQENVKWFTLTFKSNEYENMVSLVHFMALQTAKSLFLCFVLLCAVP